MPIIKTTKSQYEKGGTTKGYIFLFPYHDRTNGGIRQAASASYGRDIHSLFFHDFFQDQIELHFVTSLGRHHYYITEIHALQEKNFTNDLTINAMRGKLES